MTWLWWSWLGFMTIWSWWRYIVIPRISFSFLCCPGKPGIACYCRRRRGTLSFRRRQGTLSFRRRRGTLSFRRRRGTPSFRRGRGTLSFRWRRGTISFTLGLGNLRIEINSDSLHYSFTISNQGSELKDLHWLILILSRFIHNRTVKNWKFCI